ncbi:uncharacterized protein LOC144873039 [Branchiostoma floridae x Branchiostoma japonicum]
MPPRKKARKAARPEAGDDPSPTERGDQPSPEDAPPQPTRKAPDKPKLTMKFLQKQLEDLQQVTTQIANKLNSTNSSDPQTPGALPTDGGSAGLVGLNTSPSSVTVTHVTDTPGVLPIATTSGAQDPQPPSLPSINPNAQMPGLGSTLASSILGTSSLTKTVNASALNQPASVVGTPAIESVLSGELYKTGVHLPLDTGIPEPTKEKIWLDKYVEFKHLLPTHRPKAQFNINLEPLAGLPTLTVANNVEDSKNSLSLAQWSNAFAIYQYIYVQKHVLRSTQLISYGYLIRSMADRGAQWGKYDMYFRQLRQINPNLPWDVPHPQLYVDAFSSLALASSSPKPSFPKTNKIPRGYCFQYHLPGGQCSTTGCPYKHSCPTCSGPHKEPNCPKKAQLRNNNTRNR